MNGPAQMYASAKTMVLRGPGWIAKPVVARFPATSVGTGRFLLIHGNPSNLSEWAQTVEALQALGDVVALDMPGFGRSEPLVGAAPTLNAFADIIAALIHQLGWVDANFVGQSHGGLVCHTLAARHPGLVRSVVFLGTGGTPAHLSYRLLPLPGVGSLLGSTAAERLLASQSLRPTVRRLVAFATRPVFAPDPVPEGFVDSQVEELGTRAHILRTMVEVTLDGPCDQVAEQACRVRAPCLFIHGSGDQLVPIRYARRLHKRTKCSCAATFVAVDGGHMVHLARPNVVNPLIVSWLQKL